MSMQPYTAVQLCAPRSASLIWLDTHHFITLQMEQTIHARDVRNPCPVSGRA